MEAAGYSGTPLAKKLGIKPGFKMRVVNGPVYYNDLFVNLPEDLEFTDDITVKKNLIHFFTVDLNELQERIIPLKEEISQDGMLWISWPKKASRVPTNITEDLIRSLALQNGLVDVKVCAVDEVWSGLKLVIPVSLRTPHL